MLVEGETIQDFGEMSKIPPDYKLKITDYELTTHQFTNSPAHQLTSSPVIIDVFGKKWYFPLSATATRILYMPEAGRSNTSIRSKGCLMRRLQNVEEAFLILPKRLHEATEDELVEQALGRLNEIMMLGLERLRSKVVMDLRLRMS